MKKEDEFVPLWLSILVSGFAWFSVSVMTILLFSTSFIFIMPPALIVDPQRRLMHGVAQFWGFILITLVPFWKFQVTGRGNVGKGPYVVISNHQSFLDILTGLACIPLHFKFIAKKELFRIPFLGWHMALAKYIALDRSSRNSGRDALFQAAKLLKSGVSVLLFPEGTRSTDGEIHTFKGGAFRLAQECGVPILPVVIDGTGDAVPKNSKRLIKRTLFRIAIGKPVVVKPQDTPEELKLRFQKEMTRRLHQMREAA